jgi:hypothetical protein
LTTHLASSASIRLTDSHEDAVHLEVWCSGATYPVECVFEAALSTCEACLTERTRALNAARPEPFDPSLLVNILKDG